MRVSNSGVSFRGACMVGLLMNDRQSGQQKVLDMVLNNYG